MASHLQRSYPNTPPLLASRRPATAAAPSADGGLGSTYSRLLDDEPVLTKGATSFVLSSMSSIVAQLIKTGGKWDAGIPLSAAKFGVTKTPPYSHFWYPILERINKNPLFRVIVDQIFWRPFLTAYTIFFMSMVQGLTWPQVRRKGQLVCMRALFLRSLWWPHHFFSSSLTHPSCALNRSRPSSNRTTGTRSRLGCGSGRRVRS